MGTEKSHNLQAAESGKPVGGVIPVQRPKNQGSQWYNSDSEVKSLRTRGPDSKGQTPKVKELEALMSKGMKRWTSQLKRGNFSFFHFFVLCGPSMDCMMLAHIGEDVSSLLNLLSQMLIFSRNTLKTHPEIMFCQLSGHSFAQSSWHRINYHNALYQVKAIFCYS